MGVRERQQAVRQLRGLTRHQVARRRRDAMIASDSGRRSLEGHRATTLPYRHRTPIRKRRSAKPSQQEREGLGRRLPLSPFYRNFLLRDPRVGLELRPDQLTEKYTGSDPT